MTEADITCAIMARCVAEEGHGWKARVAAKGRERASGLCAPSMPYCLIFWANGIAMRKPKSQHRRNSPPRRRPAFPASGFAEATAHPLAAEQAIVTTISPGGVPHRPAVRAMPVALADLTRHGFSEEEIWALVVPKRTLARRVAGNEPLTVDETDKAIRLERIAALADRVFGDPAKARRWLRKPKIMLNGATPVAFLASETGARTVEEMLYQIQHGMFA